MQHRFRLRLPFFVCTVTLVLIPARNCDGQIQVVARVDFESACVMQHSWGGTVARTI